MKMAEIGKGMQYVTSLGGLFKILEMALLFVALGVVGLFLKNGPEKDYEKKNRVEFFIAATAIAIAVTVVFFMIFLTGIHKIVNIAWTKTGAGVFAFLGILVVVGSTMLLEAHTSYNGNNFCAILETLNNKVQCKHLLTGMIFGFIAAAAFIVDAIIHYKMRYV